MNGGLTPSYFWAPLDYTDKNISFSVVAFLSLLLCTGSFCSVCTRPMEKVCVFGVDCVGADERMAGLGCECIKRACLPLFCNQSIFYVSFSKLTSHSTQACLSNGGWHCRAPEHAVKKTLCAYVPPSTKELEQRRWYLGLFRDHSNNKRHQSRKWQ